MRVDLERKLQLPQVIKTILRLDVIIWTEQSHGRKGVMRHIRGKPLSTRMSILSRVCMQRSQSGYSWDVQERGGR